MYGWVFLMLFWLAQHGHLCMPALVKEGSTIPGLALQNVSSPCGVSKGLRKGTNTGGT